VTFAVDHCVCVTPLTDWYRQPILLVDVLEARSKHKRNNIAEYLQVPRSQKVSEQSEAQR